MKDNITFLKFNNYINRNLSEYLSNKKDNNITDMIEYIKNNFDKDEVIPTLLNIIESDIESKDLITYLDLINYYISIVSSLKIDSFKKLITEKLQKLLGLISKPENRSIVYQYIIDYSALYDIDIHRLKKTFPIDRDMFLKKVVELATTKPYLRFLLIYEVSIFFSKEEINYMWLNINSFTNKEKYMFFNIFLTSFDDKNQKKIYKFLGNSNKEVVSKFIPTLKYFYKDKELYFKNIFSLDAEQFNEQEDYQIKNGLFSQSRVFFSPTTQKMIFISDFFEYKKYTLIIETDFNLKYFSSKIVKQPMIFNRDFFFKNYKKDFYYQLRLDPIIAKEMYKGILFKIKKREIDLPLVLINYFTFRNIIENTKYSFTIEKELEIKDFYVGKHIFDQIIKNNLHTFIDLESLLPKNLSYQKKELKLFLTSPIFKTKFDKYINENKIEVLNSIKIFIEFSKSLNNKKDMINFFILLYKQIRNEKNNYIEISQLKHLLLFYLSHENEVD